MCDSLSTNLSFLFTHDSARRILTNMDHATLMSDPQMVTLTTTIKFDFNEPIEVPSSAFQGRAIDKDDIRNVMISSKDFVGQLLGNKLRIDAKGCPAFWLQIDINEILKLVKTHDA